jgi:hypothetical protein
LTEYWVRVCSSRCGSGIVKVKQFGDGLYLRPYCAKNITGDGLFIKQGGNYEPVNDASIRDIALLANLQVINSI